MWCWPNIAHVRWVWSTLNHFFISCSHTSSCLQSLSCLEYLEKNSMSPCLELSATSAWLLHPLLNFPIYGTVTCQFNALLCKYNCRYIPSSCPSTIWESSTVCLWPWGWEAMHKLHHFLIAELSGQLIWWYICPSSICIWGLQWMLLTISYVRCQIARMRCTVACSGMNYV